MWTKQWTAVLAVSMLGLAAGCMPIPSPTPAAIALSERDNNTQARVAIDGVVTVVLADNSGSTGCTWQWIPANDLVLEELISGIKPSDSGLVGAPGEAVWVFSANTVGTTTLRMEKTCPDGSKTEFRVELTVMPGGF